MLWEHWTLERARRLFFDLAYTLHGGSGLPYTRGDLENMALSELLWTLYALNDVREEEAAAMKKGS